MLDNGSYKLVSKCISAIVTVSANSVDSDLECTSRIYFDNVTLTLRHRNHANTITSVIDLCLGSFCDLNCYSKHFQTLILVSEDQVTLLVLYAYELATELNCLTPVPADNMELFRT